jgi:hypothetical protein
MYMVNHKRNTPIPGLAASSFQSERDSRNADGGAISQNGPSTHQQPGWIAAQRHTELKSIDTRPAPSHGEALFGFMSRTDTVGKKIPRSRPDHILVSSRAAQFQHRCVCADETQALILHPKGRLRHAVKQGGDEVRRKRTLRPQVARFGKDCVVHVYRFTSACITRSDAVSPAPASAWPNRRRLDALSESLADNGVGFRRRAVRCAHPW